MIAPILPEAEKLPRRLAGKADRVLIDKLNYHHADAIYRRYQLEYAMTQKFFTEKKTELSKA
ncbi:radical SAM protein, partial [Candidatus Bathyarchaeota archaeon]|nr:radical SAM protein [Candidatus Bathyarchaeota archaeon]